MRQVTKEEFFAYMNPLDVIPTAGKENGQWRDVWKTREGVVVGRSVWNLSGGVDAYFLT